MTTNLTMVMEYLIDLGQKAAQAIKNSLVDHPDQILSEDSQDGIKALIDTVSNNIILNSIVRDYPGVPILSEESDGRSIEDYSKIDRFFCVDPVDGTRNLTSGQQPVYALPGSTVSLAYLEGGQVQVGVVRSILEAKCVFGARRTSRNTPGQAWTLDQSEPLKVNTIPTLDKSLVGLEVSMAANQWLDGEQRALMNAFLPPGVAAFRTYEAGAQAIANVALGIMACTLHPKTAPHDHAAASLLVELAGGRVTDIDGSPFNPLTPGILASNGLVHDQALAEIHQALANL